MKTIRIIILSILVLVICSCSTKSTLSFVTLKKGTMLAKMTIRDTNTAIREYSDISEENNSRENSLSIYKCEKPTEAILKLKDGSIELELMNPIPELLLKEPISDVTETPSSNYQPASHFTYSSVLPSNSAKVKAARIKLNAIIQEDSVSLIGKYFYDNKLIYKSRKPIFQALSIPFKLRGSKDDFPSNVSTGFNAGIALGYNWDFNRTRPIRLAPANKMIGYKTSKQSLVLAPFIGLTSIGLTATNTRQNVMTDQSVLGVSTGLTAAVKINSFTIGPAIGADWGLKNSSNWIYQGSIWTGIVIGIDTFK